MKSNQISVSRFGLVQRKGYTVKCMNRIIERFDKKIKEFESHKEYSWLIKEAEKAKRSYDGFGLEAIISEDFIERIVAMPHDYIQNWLDKKHDLKWRECDKKNA